MHGNRMERVQEEIRREIGDILQRRAQDPRLAWVSVVRVEVSRDLSSAKVHVSTLGDEEAREGAFAALVKAGPFLRGELGRRIHLRRIPELRFQADDGIETSIRINRMLQDLVPSDEGGAEASAGPVTDGPDERPADEPADGLK